jgi:arginase family enzyme
MSEVDRRSVVFIDFNIPAFTPGLGYPVPGGNKYRNLALQVEGVSKIETIKYAHESRETQI